MRPPRLRTSSDDSWAAATAAAMTFLVSVALDLAGGASVEHVVALGALAAAAGALRLHRIGREHRWGARSAGAVVLAQPGLHIAGTTWNRWSADLRPGHTAVQLGLLVVFVVIAASLALLVVAADVVLLACAGAVHRLACALLRPSEASEPPHVSRPRSAVPVRAARFLPWAAYAVRRGPPRVVVA